MKDWEVRLRDRPVDAAMLAFQRMTLHLVVIVIVNLLVAALGVAVLVINVTVDVAYGIVFVVGVARTSIVIAGDRVRVRNWLRVYDLLVDEVSATVEQRVQRGAQPMATIVLRRERGRRIRVDALFALRRRDRARISSQLCRRLRHDDLAARYGG